LFVVVLRILRVRYIPISGAGILGVRYHPYLWRAHLRVPSLTL
jgi:hypothetical protein